MGCLVSELFLDSTSTLDLIEFDISQKYEFARGFKLFDSNRDWNEYTADAFSQTGLKSPPIHGLYIG